MNNTESESHITIPIGKKAHLTAAGHAASTTSPDKGKQVYLNTLAVYAVHCYLNWLAIESDLEQSDSWSLGIHGLTDLADLVLPGIGSLECRSILPEETSFIVPPQATENRIGYVAVRLNESLDRAELLGFLGKIAPASQPQQIAIARLQPLDVLLERIPVTTQTNNTNKVLTNLSRWLESTFENGWLTMEALFEAQANPALAVRNEPQSRANNLTSAVKRGKLIDLGIQLAGEKVALIVTCQPADEEMEIRLQVYPAERFMSLPPNLQLTVLDEMGTISPELQVRARDADDCIQLEFTGKVGERFSVVIALEDVRIAEDFQI